MSEIFISKEKLTSISFNEDDNILSINWWTGGEKNAVCGLKLKVELVEKIKSNYTPPVQKYKYNYNEPF